MDGEIRYIFYITVVRRPSAHTRPNAHPQTLENLNFFPSLFNIRVKAHPKTFTITDSRFNNTHLLKVSPVTTQPNYNHQKVLSSICLPFNQFCHKNNESIDI